MPSANNIFDEIRLKQHDEDYEPRNDCHPTAARPGSLEKLFVLADRVENGQPLHHPFDECILATVSEEFEKAKFVNKIFRERYQERVQRRKKHG